MLNDINEKMLKEPDKETNKIIAPEKARFSKKQHLKVNLKFALLALNKTPKLINTQGKNEIQTKIKSKLKKTAASNKKKMKK